MTTPLTLQLGDRVRIGASPRIGTIKSLYDGPYEGGLPCAKAYALIETAGGFDARPVSELSPAPEPNGESA